MRAIAGGQSQTEPRWPWIIGFFVVCPVVLSFPLGWYEAGAAALLPSKSSAMALWACQWLMSWWIAEALFQGARAAMRPLTDRLLAPLLAAAIGNALLASLYAAPYFDLVAALSGSTARLPTSPAGRNLFDPAYLWVLAQATAPGALVWMALRALFERLAPTAPPRTAGAPPASGAAHRNRLLAAAAAQNLAPNEIIAATAEDHYVRLHAARRTILLSWRFADAMDDLGVLEGVRTHRSAWVRLSAVAGVERAGGRRQVVLSSGQRFPLSERHAGLLEFALSQGGAGRADRTGPA
jgi:hypothetical protein